jgi:hypothetical protein
VTTPNPPIPGHHLLYEGRCWLSTEANRILDRLYTTDQPIEENWARITPALVEGGCQCGAMPTPFDPRALPSRGAMQKWHRQHKEELRGTLRVDRVKLLHQVLDDAEESLRLGDFERMHKVIFVWSQRREHLLAGEETWEDQHI